MTNPTQPQLDPRPIMVECAGNALESTLADLRARGARIATMETPDKRHPGLWRLRLDWGTPEAA